MDVQQIVAAAANRIAKRIPTGAIIEASDLISSAWVRLIGDLPKFDPDKGEFVGWLNSRASLAMLDHLRSIDHISRAHRRQIDSMIKEQDPKAEPIKAPSQLSAIGLEDGYDPPDPESDFTRHADSRILLLALLRKAKLGRRNSYILRLRYLQGKTAVQLAAKFGVSESRIVQVCTAGLEKLQEAYARRRKYRLAHPDLPVLQAKCEYCHQTFGYYRRVLKGVVQPRRFCSNACSRRALIPRKLPDAKIVLRHYIDEKMTKADIARKYGVCNASVIQMLKRIGVTTRPFRAPQATHYCVRCGQPCKGYRPAMAHCKGKRGEKEQGEAT